MKKMFLRMATAVLLCAGPASWAGAGEMDVLLGKLVEKGILTPNECQVIMAEAKQEAAKELAKGEATTAPAWTQKIKISGDGRYRTQTDWGKPTRPQPYRVRQRFRARLGVDAKVNDQIYGGVRVATGNDNKANSTNQTLTDNFSKKPVWLDQFYVLWTPKIPKEVGETKVWGGKFQNPFQCTEIMWDQDINPEGTAVQYVSPQFFNDTFPTNFYSNTGTFWLGESAAWGADPMLWAAQVGFKSLVYNEWDTTLDFSVTNYNFVNNDYKAITFAVGDNQGIATKFNDVDLLLQLDSQRFMSLEVPWGAYTDFIDNTNERTQTAFCLGGYLGKKKPKDKGDWKGWLEYRSLDRNSVPDWMPDSDFFGYTPYGIPTEGGTNTRGINMGVQYAIYKDTVLNLEYYYTTPISVNKVTGYQDSPYQLMQADVNIKF